MKILVYDVAAEHGGALAILKNVYKYAVKHTEIDWVFVLSIVQFEQKPNIMIDNYVDVKKNWLNRIKFDKIDAPKIIKKYNPDIVLNMQNIALKTEFSQVLYMHQSIPFADYKFKIKDLHYWIYQNIIGGMIKYSFKYADKIIVQTNWIKNAILAQTKVNQSKIEVQQPIVDLSQIKENTVENKIYFYPASESIYKNHKVVVDACSLLSANGYNNYKVIFTLHGNETKYIQQLYNKSQRENLNIEWIGKIRIEDVYNLYAESNLIFPSFIETFGLPLLEARTANAVIFASDTPFAREILDGYGKVEFFKYDDAEMLASLIKGF